MQRLLPNTILQNRFLLKEELSVEQQTGQQVWAVLDQQTGQSLVARFYADGRVEWFTDNRPAPATPLPVTRPKPQASRQGLLADTSRLFRYLWVVALVIGVAVGGYVVIQALRNTPAPATAADSTTVHSRPVVTVAPLDSPPAAAPISAEQAMYMLNSLKQIPKERHPTIFADARLAFTALRQTPGSERYVDSLYVICVGRGTQSYLATQQNGDSFSKSYALDWYQMAYALKPSPDLRERLKRLHTMTRKPPARPGQPTRKARTREPLFIDDPEVTH